MTSWPKISGIRRRDSVTAMRCASRVAAAPVRFKKLPTRPLRTSASCSGVGCWFTESWLSWPSFSSRVMRARRESIFCSAAERCANAGPAMQSARAAGNAVRKPLWGRIGIQFQKEKYWKAAPPIYPALTDLDKPQSARDKGCKHVYRRRAHEPHIVRATRPAVVARPVLRRDRRAGGRVADQHRQHPGVRDRLGRHADRGGPRGRGERVYLGATRSDDPKQRILHHRWPRTGRV